MREAIRMYYDIFPESREEIGGRYADIYTSIDLKERNRMILLRAVDAGYFSMEDISVLINLQVETLHGMMATYKDYYRMSGIADRAVKNYMFILDSLHAHYRLK